MSLKNKIIELMEYNDLIVVDHNVSGALKIINEETTISNDDFYVFESWNDVNEIERLTGLDIDNIFEDWGFSDEYILCCHCGDIIHTSELNYYGNDYWINDYEIICGNCVKENKDFTEDYIKYLINNSENANTILSESQLEDIGFKICNCDDEQCEFWSGLRNCQDDDPKQILKNAIKLNPNMDYIFDITRMSMFDTEFTLYHRCKNE